MIPMNRRISLHVIVLYRDDSNKRESSHNFHIGGPGISALPKIFSLSGDIELGVLEIMHCKGIGL